MRIKTVVYNADAYGEFDNTVNDALERGWVLVERKILPPGGAGDLFALYAELVWLDKDDRALMEGETGPEPITWQQAAKVLHDICANAKDCTPTACPMYAWCDKGIPVGYTPDAWDVPED